MDKGAWQATVHGVAKSQKPLSDYHSLTECRLNLEHHHESVICSVVSNTFATP